MKGYKREVFLKGEGFFEVAKDAKHSFIVSADDLKIRVLGTKFNVTAYPEDQMVSTVLVEGQVGLYKGNNYNSEQATILKPDDLGTSHKSSNKISQEKVDVKLFTSWTKGVISFKHVSFKNILKKLERKYDRKIICSDPILNETCFTSSFDNVELEYILKSFEENYGIKYTKEKTKIIINF